MRLLALAPDQNRRYQLLQWALLRSPLGLQKGEHGPHADMCEKFYAIGDRDPRSLPTEDMPDPLPIYKLIGGEIKLEETPFALLKKHFDASLEHFPKPWSKEVGETEAWLAAIPKTDA